MPPYFLRKPKLHDPKARVKDIEDKYIPLFEKRILSKLIEIQVDLLIAKDILIKHKNLQSKFNSFVEENVINKIHIEIHMFNSEKKSPTFNVEDCELFIIIFPSEKRKKSKVKESILGTGVQIIDDEFNEIIENNFQSIYSDLEDNLVDSGKIKLVKKISC